MARHTKIVNVIDLEATCWSGNPPTGQYSEIIEIGICEVNLLDCEMESKRSILVAPEASKVSDFCTNLTGHTQKELDDKAVPFEAAMQILLDEYGMKSRVMVSWGDYDRKMFDRAYNARGNQRPWQWRHLNLKAMFSMLRNPEREVGMDTALKLLKLPLIGRHHNGADDAANIAAILLDLQRSVMVDI